MASHPQQQTDKTPADIEDRIWELARRIDFCMFVSWDGERQQARPLSSRVKREQHAIYFLVSATGTKNEQVEQYPTVNLAYADPGAMKYLSISGQAVLSNDRAKIKELWSDFDKAWWDDENDPDIRLLTVSPERGELWDSPSKAVALVTMIAAAVTGAKPDFGDNATVRM
jgi:general stress protein 26